MKPVAVLSISVAALLLGAARSATPRAEDQSGRCAIAFNPASPLRARVGAPPPDILDAYRRSGAKDVRPHRLTDAEWKTVDAAIAALPRVHRDVLQRHLRRISFVDASSGAGNALTSRGEPACGEALFDLTLRAGLLGESLTAFLSGKESGLFADDGSGMTVRIEAGAMPAAPYILLHESTHIVDGVLGLSEKKDAAFRREVWDAAQSKAFVPELATNPINGIAWRGGAKLPIGDAANLYRGLRQSPFVSLYASVAPSEDLAELVAWQQLSARWQVPLRIVVRRADGATAFEYKPLEAPAVRARMASASALLVKAN
ncbi:hypothetical protein ABIC65_002625 [Sphingomonas trueperi]|uniref:hypothetical protein n=1 Tax=Sphingomonas trueperi TaxID=53317 RepID=UPI0033954E97